MNLLVLILLLGAPSRFAIPGGSIEVPAGCSANGGQLIDSWEGWIECAAPRRRIDIFAGMALPGCSERNPAQRAQSPTATLLTKRGHSLHICSWELSPPQALKRLVVDVGSSRLMTSVGDASDAAWLLALAATFEADK
jgi:hypothetical protein